MLEVEREGVQGGSVTHANAVGIRKTVLRTGRQLTCWLTR
jgi:hypothetical protein